MKTKLESWLESYHTEQSASTYLYHIDVFRTQNPKCNRYLQKDILHYMDSKLVQSLSVHGQNTKLAAIKRYYDFLYENCFRNDHPCKSLRVKGSTRGQIQLQDLFSKQELSFLLERENRYANLELRNKVIIGLLIYQGLTSAEIVNLRVDNINLDDGLVDIKASTNLAGRELNLNSGQIINLYKYLGNVRPKLIRAPTNKLVLSVRTGLFTVDAVNRMLKPFSESYSTPINPSTVRQSVISNWLNVDKIPLQQVQLIAGHKYPSSTERYLRKDVNEQRDIINKFHPLG